MSEKISLDSSEIKNQNVFPSFRRSFGAVAERAFG